jgi:hypothetical protein
MNCLNCDFIFYTHGLSRHGRDYIRVGQDSNSKPYMYLFYIQIEDTP